MTRNNRHSACWPLLTTSETLPHFHPRKISPNSLFRKILPLSLTRSGFCGAFFKTAQSFQDFRGIPGGGGTPAVALIRVQTAKTGNRRRSLPFNTHPPRGSIRTFSAPAQSDSFVSLSEPGFSRAESALIDEGLSPCGAGQGLKPRFPCNRRSARLKPGPDTKPRDTKLKTFVPRSSVPSVSSVVKILFRPVERRAAPGIPLKPNHGLNGAPATEWGTRARFPEPSAKSQVPMAECDTMEIHTYD